jgi:hypothetical protein
MPFSNVDKEGLKANGLPQHSEGVPSLGECSPGNNGHKTWYSGRTPTEFRIGGVSGGTEPFKEAEPRLGFVAEIRCIPRLPG